MRRYRKRRKTGLWLPVLGSTGVSSSSGGTGNILWGIQGSITSPSTGAGVTTLITPIVPDASGLIEAGIANLDNSWDQELSTLYGWICKRVVGTFRCAYPQAAIHSPKTILWGAGFFVAGEHPGAEEVPAGASSDNTTTGVSAETDETFFAYSPLANTATTFPWMWRKTWLLSNDQSSETESVLVYSPNNDFNTGTQGSNVVDIKTRRHIKPNTRLYFAQSVCAYPLKDDTIYSGTEQLPWRLDVRVYGSLTRPKQGASFR